MVHTTHGNSKPLDPLPIRHAFLFEFLYNKPFFKVDFPRQNDINETNAIKQVFNANSKNIPVSSTKSMTGHLLGGAGGIEAGIVALALHNGVLLPTINLDNPDEGCDLDYIPHEARDKDIKVAISNSFGFGGTNVTLAFRKFEG